MKNSKVIGKVFDNKIFRMIISLLASLLIWIYVTGTQEEVIFKDLYNISVVFSGADAMKESKGFVVTDVDTESVSVRISGTRQNIGKLDSSDLKAVINLSKVTKIGNNLFRYDIEYPDGVDDSAVTVESYSPENIQFTVAKLTTKTVPVKGMFLGSAAEGFVAEKPTFEPETVTLTGPDSQLANIEYVWVTLGGDDVSSTKTADVPFVYMGASGNQLDYDDITADYDTVTMTLPIKMKKEVPLIVNLVDGAGATVNNSVVTINPSTITILGDAAIVNGINKIVLATVDLSSFSATLDETYPIVLDNEVENVTGKAEAKVKIEIIGLQTKKFTITNLSCVNVPAGYTAEMLTESREVTIRATEDVLSRITSDNLRAVADMTGYSSTGEVSVPVKIKIDGYSDAGAIGEYKVNVNIEEQ